MAEFEGGQLVKLILRKVVFACKASGRDAVVGSAMTSVLLSWWSWCFSWKWKPLADSLGLCTCTCLLSTKEETVVLRLLAPAWPWSSWLASSGPHEVRLA